MGWADVGENAHFVIEWIGRMTTQFGPNVLDMETGRVWDWGQALCRAQYGPDWSTRRDLPDEPTDTAVSIARQWEGGAWPEWADR